VRRILKVIDSISHWSGEIVKHAVWLMVAVLCYEVLLRYVFDAPTIWAHETTKQLFGMYSVLLGAYCLRYGHHVKIDLIYGAVPKRTRAIFDSITTLFIFLFLFLMLWRGVISAAESYRLGEVPHVIPFKPLLWPMKASIPLAAALAFLQGIANWIRSLKMAFTGKELV
jgi:TRAP-type mannitol/chloroaromatic compound transport system permease small subunit